MPTVIKGQPPSEQVREQLAVEGRPVLVAFSGGKDAIAAELALADAGVETILVYLYYIPGRRPGRTLAFVEEGLTDLEQSLGKIVHRYPNPSLYRWLNNLVFQPPERCAIIEAAAFPDVTHDEMWELIRKDLGLPADTWVADGVRAADSIARRTSLVRSGLLKPKHHKVSPIGDWLKAEVLERIAAAGIALPVDYEWFGRSFDGIDHRFLAPIREHAPADYQRILDWFPLAELELVRETMVQVSA